ncbi:MAG: hypothetical protein VB104_02730 [Candidatus Limiplasma sp.]|nr:hypothetical protein [Candidatus Limiplasma sp.]
MTLDQFAALLIAIDPDVKHFDSMAEGNFTVWQEYERIKAYADGRNQGGWKVQVERYTTDEADAVATTLEAAFDASDEIAFLHEVDYDQSEGIIRHLFDCEVW